MQQEPELEGQKEGGDAHAGRASLKILYVIDFMLGPVAGTERQLLYLMRGLIERGIHTQLAVFRATPYIEGGHGLPTEVHVLGIERLASVSALRGLLQLARFIRRNRIDLVHIFFNDAAIVAPLFCWLGGARVVVSRRDLGFWYTRATLAALRLSKRFVDIVVANSEAVRRNVAEQEGYKPAQVRVIPNGHDLQSLSEKPLGDLRQRLGIAATAPVVGIVANLKPVKRHSDLVAAFERVKRCVADAHLVLIGAGPLEASLRAQVQKLNLQEAVHFLGSLDDVIPFVKEFSVAVLCSESEGLSNALIEYMACGVPVVATRVGGNADVVRHGQNGLLLEVGDTEVLASHIRTLLIDRTRARALGEAARRTVESFTVARMVEAHVRTYEALCLRGGSGRRLRKVS